MPIAPKTKKIIIDRDSSQKISNLEFKNVLDIFQDFQNVLNSEISIDSFKKLSVKLNSMSTLLEKYKDDVDTALAVVNNVQGRLYNAEMEFYTSPDGLELIDESKPATKPKSKKEQQSTSSTSSTPVINEGDTLVSELTDAYLAYYKSYLNYAKIYDRYYEKNPNTDLVLPPQQIPKKSKITIVGTLLSLTEDTESTINKAQESIEDLFSPSLPQNDNFPKINEKFSRAQMQNYITLNENNDPKPHTHTPESSSSGFSQTEKSEETISRSAPDRSRHKGAKTNVQMIVKPNSSKYAFSNHNLNVLKRRINGKHHLVDDAVFTNQGNICLKLAKGIGYRDVFGPENPELTGFTIINSSDLHILSAHGVPIEKPDGSDYSLDEFQTVIEDSGLRLSKRVEVISKHEDTVILKLCFDSEEDRDEAYFRRALYFGNERATLRIYPQEWLGNNQTKAHNDRLFYGRHLNDLKVKESTLRFFQANCNFSLQVSHDVLFELACQAHFLLVQDPWVFNDGKPCNRVEWKTYSEPFYYEQGGTRMALYQYKQGSLMSVNHPYTRKPVVSVYEMDSFSIIHVDRPSNYDVATFLDEVKMAIQTHVHGDMVLAGCFNLQHPAWDKSKGVPSEEAENIFQYLTSCGFVTLSPKTSEYIDEDNYYTNPTLLFAQKWIASRITVNVEPIELGTRLKTNLRSYHRFSWDIMIPSSSHKN